MSLKILIIDEDVIFVSELRKYLGAIGIEKIMSLSSCKGALEVVNDYKPNVVIIELTIIQCSEDSSFFDETSDAHIPLIIVTNSRDDHIFDLGSKFKPYTLLTKPIDTLAFRFAIDSLNAQLIQSQKNEELQSDPEGDYIFIRNKNSYDRIPFSEILFIYAEGNYITIFGLKKKYVVRSSLKRCLEHLSDNYFIQIHRKYVVNLHLIDSLSLHDNSLSMGNHALPIGRSYKAGLIDQLQIL